MKKTSAKNTTSRSAKATGGRASGRTQRASANARSAAAGSRKAATSRAGTGTKPTAKKATAKTAAKPKPKVAANTRSKVAAKPKARTAAKAAPKKAASRSAMAPKKAASRSTAARRATAPKTAVRNSRSTTRVARAATRKQASTKDLLLELFHDEIKDIYWAEKNIIKGLPKLKKAATSPELQAAFDAHLAQTREHASRLEEVFEKLDKKAQAKKCEAMEGLLKESESIISDTEAGTATRDVGLILAAQKVEHYEIATYGGLAQLARTLRLDDIAMLLETTLQEEKDTDMKLTNIAESHVNYDALAESEGPQPATRYASNGSAPAAAASVGGDEDDDDDEEDEEDIDFEEADIDVDEAEDEEEDDDDFEDLDEDEDETEDEQI